MASDFDKVKGLLDEIGHKHISNTIDFSTTGREYCIFNRDIDNEIVVNGGAEGDAHFCFNKQGDFINMWVY